MRIVNCWIEHPIRNLDQTFSYMSEEEVLAGCRVLVPFGNRELTGFVESVEETELSQDGYEKKYGIHLRSVKKVIDREPLITSDLHDLAMYMKKITLSTTISCFQAMLPAKIRPSGKGQKAVMERWVKVSDQEAVLTPRQLEAYFFVRDHGEIPYSLLRRKYPNQAAALLEKKALEESEKEKRAVIQEADSLEKPYPLNDEQQKAFDEISKSGDEVFLLKGVTGSGKTEVYFHLAEEVLSSRRQVLILVPEISLTPQMIERVRRRFGNAVAVYHSGLNNQEKYEQYQLVKERRVSIVVGTRSSVFMPFSDLGLIIMDEEHDSSYKQENQPAYHTRDIAISRGHHFHAKVILGSATPSLDSYARALKGVYHLVRMDHRINDSLPLMTCVDMRKAMENGESEILSDTLIQKIGDRLAKGEQVILLLNRRGFHTQLRCRKCNEILKCPHCELSLSYHKDLGRMKCHACGAEYRVPAKCPCCGSTAGFTTFGYGTQKLEDEVKKVFPETRVLRMDADTTSRKNSHERILNSFAEHQADILVGTQMIAKGLDFPDVTLVGILNADEGLNRTDFHSCESTFDLLMQASGRSGRSERKGEVVLQAFDMEHYAIQCALSQDYDAFYRQEMQFRHATMYPPYTYLIALSVSNRNRNKADELALRLQNEIHGNFRVIGVISLLKIADQYRNRVLLKGRNLDEMRNAVQNWLNAQKTKPEGLRIDVNPVVLD